MQQRKSVPTRAAQKQKGAILSRPATAPSIEATLAADGSSRAALLYAVMTDESARRPHPCSAAAPPGHVGPPTHTPLPGPAARGSSTWASLCQLVFPRWERHPGKATHSPTTHYSSGTTPWVVAISSGRDGRPPVPAAKHRLPGVTVSLRSVSYQMTSFASFHLYPKHPL